MTGCLKLQCFMLVGKKNQTMENLRNVKFNCYPYKIQFSSVRTERKVISCHFIQSFEAVSSLFHSFHLVLGIQNVFNEEITTSTFYCGMIYILKKKSVLEVQSIQCYFCLGMETRTGNRVIHSHLQDDIPLTGMQTWKGATQSLLKYYTVFFSF